MNLTQNSKAMIGVVLNAVFAAFLVLFSVRHPNWELMKERTAEARAQYYEELLHILLGQVLLYAAGAMLLSVILFWMLRKIK